METRLLTSLGRVAGLAGISLGLVLLIFRDFLKQKFLPSTGLEQVQAYHILLAFLVFTFGIAAIGIVAWIIGRTAQPHDPAPFRALVVLVGLTIAVLITASAVGLAGTPSSAPQVSAPAQPQAVQYKPFADKVSLGERDVATTHGLVLKTMFIGIGDEGPWADIAVQVGGISQAGGRYKKGDSIGLFSADCKSLTVFVKDIALMKTAPISDEQLRKMGPSAEALIQRTATLLVSGECKPEISDAPGAASQVVNPGATPSARPIASSKSMQSSGPLDQARRHVGQPSEIRTSIRSPKPRDTGHPYEMWATRRS